MKIDGQTELYGVIGWPVSHSASPSLHNAAFSTLGMNACYVPLAVAPDGLGRAVDGLRALGFKGFNVTVPHKTHIIEFLDGLEGAGAELKSVNVVLNRDGRLIGENTDAAGFRLLLEREGVTVSVGTTALLGAGGAARSVVGALRDAGASKIFIINRTFDKAASIAAEMASAKLEIQPVQISEAGAGSILAKCSVIINSTSLGLRKTDPPPLDPGLIRPEHTLIDLIYEPRETAFLEAGAAIGARTVNGYGMLVFQAAEAFRIWTGRTPPIDIMWKAGEERSSPRFAAGSPGERQI
jgi:shikimate dehydrogenase